MKRFLAVLLCLVMLFSLAPYSAFAEGEEQEASVTEQVNGQTGEEKAEEPTEPAQTGEEKQGESADESEQPAESETPVNEESAVAEPAAEETAATEEAASEEKTPKLTANLEDNSVCKIGDTGYESVAAAFTAASGSSESNITIKVIADSPETATATLSAEKTVILDLGGHTISANYNSKRLISVNSGTLIIQGNGTIDGNSKTGVIYGQGIYINGGTVELKNGTISNCCAYSTSDKVAYGGGVYVKAGSFIMSGGTISNCKAKKTDGGKTAYGGGVSLAGGNFTMSGGTITGCTAPSLSNGGSVYINNSLSVFEMNGGTIATSSVVATKGTLTVNGGVMVATVSGEGGTKTANGGWFTSAGIGAMTLGEGKFATGECDDAPNSSAPYAVVSSENYSVEYKNGTVEGDSKVTQAHGTKIALPTPTPTSGNEGKNFTEWNTNEDGTGTTFAAEQDVEFAADSTTLYAQWASDPVAKVTFGEGSKDCYTFAEAVEAANGAGTATISLVAEEVTMSEVANITGTDVTLDLNGKTLTNDSDERTFCVSGKLTICDTAGGGVVNTSATITSTTVGRGIYVVEKGSLVISGGTIAGKGVANTSDIYTQDTGSISISSGTILGIIKAKTASDVVITGGWFSNAVNDSYVPEGYVATGAYVCGAPEKTPYAVKAESAATNYTVNYRDEDIPSDTVSNVASFTLPDGKKDGYVFDYWYVEGAIETHYNAGAEVWTNADVTFVAVRSKIAAQVTTGSGEEASTTNYSSFDDAFTAAVSVDSATLKLLDVASITVQKEIPKGKNVTLDLNGFTLTSDLAEKSLLVKGVLSIKDGNENGTGKLSYTNTDSTSNGRLIYVNNTDDAKLYIISGVIESSNLNSTGNDIHIWTSTATGSSINISGGTINASVYEGSSKAVINVTGGWFRDEISSKWTLKDEEDNTYKAVKVTDTDKADTPYTVTKDVISLTFDVNGGDEGTAPDAKTLPTLEGYTIEQSNEVTIPNKEPSKSPDNDTYYVFKCWSTEEKSELAPTYKAGDSFELTKDTTLYAFYESTNDPHAQIDGTKYATITRAIEESKENDTVMVISNDESAIIYENIKVPEGKNVTLDLNGRKLENKATGSCIVNSGTLTIKDSSDNPGTISGTAQSSGGAIENKGTLTIEGGNITGEAPSKGGAIVNTGTLTIKGGLISGEITGESGSGGGIHNSGTLTVEDGTIDGNAPNYGGAIYNSGTVTLTGGTIKGTAGKNGSSIYNAKAATALTITGADVKVYGTIESGKDTTAEISLSAGSYRIKPAEAYLADDCKFVEVEDTECRYKIVSEDGCYIVSVTSACGETTQGFTKVSGGGCIAAGSNAKAVAPQLSGYTFKGWFEDYDATKEQSAKSTSYTYVFKPTEDTDLTAVYKSEGETPSKAKYQVSINSPVIVDDESFDTYNKWVESGTELTVTYNGEGTFKYWADSNTGKEVSKDNPYNDTVSKHVFLTAVTSAESESRVIYYSSYGQIVDSETWTENTKAEFKFTDKQPSVLGKEFLGWSTEKSATKGMTPEGVKALIGDTGNEVISLYPVYKESETTCIVIVKYIGVNFAEKPEKKSVGEKCTVTAPASGTDSVTFKYWKDSDGNALSEKSAYTFIPTEDCTLYAVYGDSNIDSIDYSVSIVDKSASMNRDYYRISITEAYFVKSGYSVVDTGFLMTKVEASKDDMLVGADGINVFRCSNTTRDGRYTLNLNTKVSDRTYYVRAYMTYMDDSKNTYTVYTDVAKVSYNSVIGE